MSEDELETLLAAIAETGENDSVTEQALMWLIDSRREWRRRALAAEAKLDEHELVGGETVG